VVGINQQFSGYQSQQAFLHLEYRLARGDPGAVGNPEDMRIDGHGRLAERRVQDHIGGFSSNARQCLQGGPVCRDLAVVLADEYLAGLNDVFCLAVEQTDGLYVLLQAIQSQSMDGFW